MSQIVPLESNFLVPGPSFWIPVGVLLLVVLVAVGVVLLARSGSTGRRSADRLRELRSLLDQGLVTQAEYDERHRAVIDGL
jgi:hypothetical protein